MIPAKPTSDPNFKRVSSTGGPYNGSTTWEWEGYRVVETRLGGMQMRTRYRMYFDGEELDWYDTKIHRASFKQWVLNTISKHQERQNADNALPEV